MLVLLLMSRGAASGVLLLFMTALAFFASDRSRSNLFFPESSVTLATFFLCFMMQTLMGSSMTSPISSLGYLMKICSGFIMLALAGRIAWDYKYIVTVTALFVLVFGAAIVMSEFSAGLSLARDSALGYGSKNYTSAVLYLGLPLLLHYLERGGSDPMLKGLCILSTGLIILAVLISASKTAATCLAALLIMHFFKYRKHAVHMLAYLLLFFLIGVAFLQILRSDSVLGAMFSRAISYFGENANDSSRGVLREYALSMFGTFDSFTKLFGMGDVHFTWGGIYYPPHNMFLEVLISFGVVGLISFCGGYLAVIIRVLRFAEREERFFVIQLLVIFLLTGFFQPFFTTSYVTGLTVALSLTAIGLYSEANNGTGGENG